MSKFFKLFAREESGATLVEYGVALILAIVVGGVALTALGGETTAAMIAGCDELQPVVTGVTWDNTSGTNC